MNISKPLQFPTIQPAGFPMLQDEPVFDPARHLKLEKPTHIVSLGELGYGDKEIARCPCDLGVTSSFRILSDEGVACLAEVARNLTPYVRTVERISRMVRGGAYQSRFLRDLCLSPEVAEFLSEVCGTVILPHSLPHQLGHLNYNPDQIGKNVDKWHVDTLRLDYVLFVTDPNAIEGGSFEYFKGTKHEMQELTASGAVLPKDRIVAPDVPGAGYAVMQQGNMVVHRATALREIGERITMVNGFVPGETGFPDYTRFDQLCLADPVHIASSEYARHISWMGREMLDQDILGQRFDDDRGRYASRLEEVAALLTSAANDIRRAGDAKMEHFGD